MCKKNVTAIVLAAAISLALPFSSFAQATDPASTPGPKAATHAPAKSKQAIAAKRGPKSTPKKPVKKATHHRPAAKKHT